MKKASIIVLFLLSAVSVRSQVASGSANVVMTLTEVAMVDVEPDNSPISLTYVSPTEAGMPGESVTTANAKWLNYTSAVATGNSRIVMAQISSGSVPIGSQLRLTTGAYSGIGAGMHGSTQGSIVLSNSPQNIISGIGGAYTGNGVNNGHGMTYELSVTNYSLLKLETAATLTVSFTIMDN